DSIIDANSVQGMNQYMYTEGNPVNFRDPSGHSLAKSFFGGLKQAMHGFNVQIGKLTGRKKTEADTLYSKNWGGGLAEEYLKRSDLGRLNLKHMNTALDFMHNPEKTYSKSDFGRSDLGKMYSNQFEFMKGMLTNPGKTLQHSDFRRALGHIDKHLSDEYRTRERVREQFRIAGAYWYFKGWLWIPPPSSGNGTTGGEGNHSPTDGGDGTTCIGTTSNNVNPANPFGCGNPSSPNSPDPSAPDAD
ncbi:MAG TPA: hypothetical protein PKK05_28460, partial [Leptospiraceae bacterium]|nr:hypothetical protein [Leptospiraceae bacterium]